MVPFPRCMFQQRQDVGLEWKTSDLAVIGATHSTTETGYKRYISLCIIAADVSSINTFDIEFNLDNVKLLYDYQHGQYLYPTIGKWDYNHQNASSAFSYLDPKPDKKTKTRIKKIDDVITMRNLNLEQKKEMEDTSLWDDADDGIITPGKTLDHCRAFELCLFVSP